jgi:hypothetical protein
MTGAVDDADMLLGLLLGVVVIVPRPLSIESSLNDDNIGLNELEQHDEDPPLLVLLFR